MKSVTMSQNAFASELFFAFCRHLQFQTDNGMIDVLGVSTSHVFVMEFRVFNRENKQDSGAWKKIHEHGFSKQSKELRSVEGSDITEFINQQFHEATWDFQEKNPSYKKKDKVA